MSCKAKLRVKMAFAGRYIECPKCKKRIAVPSSQEEADEDARDYGVQQNAYEVPPNCTKCKAKMKKGAVFCVKCGFDYREGKQRLVEDFTVKEGEPMRGGPAFQMILVESVLILIGLGWLFFRGKEAFWWEAGGIAGLLVYLVAAIVQHFIQWVNYKELPIREHANVKEEDRAEREEARQPYGSMTALLFILCVGGGIGIAFLLVTYYFTDKPPAPPPKPVQKVEEPSKPAAPRRDTKVIVQVMTAAEKFVPALLGKDYAAAYEFASPMLAERMAAAPFADMMGKVFNSPKILRPEYNIDSMEKEQLDNADWGFNTAMSPEEKAQKNILETPVAPADIPTASRVAWMTVKMVLEEDAERNPTKFIPVRLLFVKGDEGRPKVAFVSIENQSQ
ncbi:MAG: zinc ribbon domain-containing protein [Planctomycetota bacterium]